MTGLSDDEDCGLTNEDPLHFAICNSVAAGVRYVAAAGNDGADLRDTAPSLLRRGRGGDSHVGHGWESRRASTRRAFPNRFSTFCDTRDDTYVGFSNFAVLSADRARVLAAPAVCVPSTVPGGGTGVPRRDEHGGPHIAGTAGSVSPMADATAPEATRQTLLDDAESLNLLNPGYGFLGDPIHPLDPSHSYFGNHVGFLVNASLY